jgi:membrane-associated phospholipid phosphatase
MAVAEITSSPAVTAPPDRWRFVRALTGAAWVVGFVLYCVYLGVPLDRGGLVVWTTLALVAVSIGRPRGWQIFLDFLPFGGALIGYDFLKVLGLKLGLPTHWHAQLEIDKAPGGGTLPTVWLQDHLKYATTQWWEVPLDGVYISFFVLPIATAAVLRLRDRRAFWRWTWRYLGLIAIAFSCFVLIPTAPPWAAARCTAHQVRNDPASPACMTESAASTAGGMIGKLPDPRPGTYPYVQRLTGRGLHEIGLTSAQHLLHEGQATSDPIAAVPSMHSAGVMLFALFMWTRVKRRYRPLLVLYPIAMGFTLVWAGEHYVTDVLTGWLAAAFVTVVAGALTRRRARRHPMETSPQLDAMAAG